MQKQVGWQSAFWLQAPHMADPDRGTATPDDTAHNGTEIDIFEYLAREDNLIHHCLHWNGYGKLHKRSPSTLKVPGLSEGFHTFGVEWRADGYTFFVDGKKTYETKDAPSATPQYILVSGEVGPWGGDITKAKLPDAVMFDYVRVYQKPAKP
jgi:beta-glucanase (GH16 family)